MKERMRVREKLTRKRKREKQLSVSERGEKKETLSELRTEK